MDHRNLKNESRELPPLFNTHVDGLDTILGGGFPAGSLYLIQGLAGSGKTTLACQMGFLQAAQGKKVLILTLIAESHAKMLAHFRNFSFYEESLVGDQILFFSGYQQLSKGGLRDLLAMIATCLAEQKPSMLIVDGFRAVRNSSSSDLDLAEFMHSLNSLVTSMACTAFLISPVEGNVADSENTLVDGVIELSQHEQGMRLIREIKLFKVRGANHLLGKHVFEVKKHGLVIYPRFEAVATHANSAPAASTEIASVGIATWDKAIGGGVVRGSVTCLLGHPGAGKTLVGLKFIEQGLDDGEACLIIGFHESPPRLVAKAAKVGIMLAGALSKGDLEINWHLPLEVLMDSVARDMVENIKRRGVTRLLIDGVEGMRNIVMHPERAPSFLLALVNELRVQNVTTFITEQLPFFKNHQDSFDGISASAMYENILLLEQVNTSKGMKREISVMKLSENEYDPSKYSLAISSAGVEVNDYSSPSTSKNVGGERS